MVGSPLIRPYLMGVGSFGGGTLDSHDLRLEVEFGTLEVVFFSKNII